MSKWQIELRNIGRGKVCRTIVVETAILPAVEQRAIRECKKHLMSRDVGLNSRGDLTYGVCAGFRSVGEVSIKTVSGKKKVRS